MLHIFHICTLLIAVERLSEFLWRLPQRFTFRQSASAVRHSNALHIMTRICQDEHARDYDQPMRCKAAEVGKGAETARVE